jgi:pyruvate dehydrogenase E2 component (dihydrolipoamide acetyltransferase)
MATPVVMPRQGQSVESCILVDWHVAVGDSVKAGQEVASIETDKAVFEIESPAEGTVLELFFETGDDIPVLTTIAAIGNPGEDVSDIKPGSDSGSTVEAAPAPAGEAAPPEPVSPPVAAPVPAPADVARGRVSASPRARRRAVTAGINIQQIGGTGPGGRVIERDVVAAEQSGARISPAAKAAMSKEMLTAPSSGSGPGGLVLTSDLTEAAPEDTVIKVSGIRKIVAERMHQSLANTAQLTLHTSFNAAAVLRTRAQIKAEGESRGLPNITLNDMIVYAVAGTLRQHAELNAHFLGETIKQFGTAHIGVATDTPRGLLVPVLRNASTLSLIDVSKNLKLLTQAAQAGKSPPSDLSGGTFTITNMGMIGIENFTPVLNAPEVAILGVGGIAIKPAEIDGEIRFIKSIPLSLTIDHQAVDGAPGARFLQDLVSALDGFELGSI